MMKNSIFLIIVLVFSANCSASDPHPFKKRQTIDYNISFSSKSEVTLVITSCGQTNKLSDTIFSFFYYNTYPLRQILLYDYCITPKEEILKSFPKNAAQNQNVINIISEKSNLIQALESLYALVKTKYILNYANKWVTYRGFGHVDDAVNVLQYAQKNSIKISQVTTLYPLWGQYRYLGKMMTTDMGVKFHEIRTFKPLQRYYFTFNPCLINFKVMYEQILDKSLKNFAGKSGCDSTDRDCIEKALGKQLYEIHKYFQVYINDGNIVANVFIQS